MISSELPEVLLVSDRVLVMREGRLAAEFTRAEATEERIIAAATGQAAVPAASHPPAAQSTDEAATNEAATDQAAAEQSRADQATPQRRVP
jgi:ABC-type uncharacterized transport system ATPase subunit